MPAPEKLSLACRLRALLACFGGLAGLLCGRTKSSMPAPAMPKKLKLAEAARAEKLAAPPACALPSTPAAPAALMPTGSPAAVAYVGAAPAAGLK